MIKDMQEHLLYLTDLIVRRNSISPKIRGVMAVWKEDIIAAHLSFYFDGELDEDEIGEVSDTCGDIIAQIPDGLLEEDYIRLDYPKPLPESPFWAYRRLEE